MEKESISVRFLYGTAPGRVMLKILTKPWISRLAGRFLDCRCSKIIIPPFIKKNGIDMREFEQREYDSFNDFFKRSLAPGSRVTDMYEGHLISPCDGALSIYELDESSAIPVKHSRYRLEGLLRDQKLSGKYKNGWCLVFRLRPSDYHHYCYIDDGIILKRKKIPGILHCVRPIALEKYPVYVQNSREYTVIDTKHFGTAVQMEIGALMVGKISNDTTHVTVKRGMEKGYFEFGGSTILVLLEKERFEPDPEILLRSRRGHETEVKAGERVGDRRAGSIIHGSIGK